MLLSHFLQLTGVTVNCCRRDMAIIPEKLVTKGLLPEICAQSILPRKSGPASR